jgi:50S ribosomal subunit-associated GTPase HflX
LVYDVTIPETFNRVKKWINELKAFNKNSVLAIAGNKCDLIKSDIDKEELNNYCKQENAKHFYTSAKSGEGLDEIFLHITKEIAITTQSYSANTGNKGKKLTVNKSDTTKPEKSGCCN